MRNIETRENLNFDMYRVEDRLNNVLAYIKENPESDPNAFEMNELMFEVAHLGYQGRKFEENPHDFSHNEKYTEVMKKFTTVMQYRMPQLLDSTQGLYAEHLHDYFDVSLNFMATLNSLGDKNSMQLFNSICGVNLYVAQQKRNLAAQGELDTVIYSNPNEYYDILEGISVGTERDVKLAEPLVSEISEAYSHTLAQLQTEKGTSK